MKWPLSSWAARHSVLSTRLLSVLLLVVLVESLLLYDQRGLRREIDAQSERLLQRFLAGDSVATSGAPGVPIRLQNVRFQWSDRVYVDAGNMAVQAMPISGSTVNFDDLDSFLLQVQQSQVVIRPSVLQGMFNESVFNYPESNVRGLEVQLKQHDGKGPYLVYIRGNVRVGVWIGFKMRTDLSVDTATNTMVIDVKDVDILGFLPVTPLIKLKPLNLEHLIALPPNKTLLVRKNRLMVKPFALFPPPRIDGRIAAVAVEKDAIRLDFSGEPIEAPVSDAANYIYLRGGSSQFGTFRLLDTNVLIVDADDADPFVFSLQRYADMIPRSVIEVHDTRSVLVRMPDLSAAT